MTLLHVFTAAGLCSVLGCLLSLSPATASPKNPTDLLLAQGASGCRAEESTFVETETANYWIYICGGDAPHTYVGVEKRNPSHWIRLPLADYDPQGNFFEAVNGEVSYILAKTARGMFLTVTQGEQELLREPVLQPW